MGESLTTAGFSTDYYASFLRKVGSKSGGKSSTDVVRTWSFPQPSKHTVHQWRWPRGQLFREGRGFPFLPEAAPTPTLGPVRCEDNPC